MDKLRGTVLEIELSWASSILEMLLRDHRHIKLLRAYSADKAIKLAERQQPDVIFLNPFMPVSGFEVDEILQSNQNTKHIPVIFYNDRIPEIETKLKESGIPYISRPVNIDELSRYLATYLTMVEE